MRTTGETVYHLPVVEHALREGLSARVRTQVLVEPEGLRYRQLALQDDAVVFLNGVEDAATALVQGGLHSAHDVGCARDLHKEDRLLLTGLCAELAGEARVSGRRRNLIGSSMDRVSVKSCVPQLLGDSTLLFEGQRT